MSSPFTYQIDERNLRMQLKNFEYPLPDNAWHKFESYASSKVVQKSPGGLATLRLNLNRNVIVPVVFGVVVVSFSIMLVNFVSLKPHEKQGQLQMQAVKALPSTNSTSQTTSIPQEKPVSVQHHEPTPQTSAPHPKPSHSSMPGEKASIPTSPTTNELISTNNAAPDNGLQVSTSAVNTELKTDSETVVKKKRRKNLDPAAQLQEEIRPTTVSDSQEEDVRPN